jgi:NitT/TauT family transport system permease protein
MMEKAAILVTRSGTQQTSLLGFLRKILWNSSAIILFLALWEVVAQLKLVSTAVFLPPFSKVFGALIDEAANGKLWDNLQISLQRALIGFAVGLSVAIPLGLAIGWFKKFGNFINPLLQVFRNMPVLALLPLFVMFFHIGEFSKIMVITWGVLWYTLLNTISGVRSVDVQLIKAARSMGTKPFRLFRSVVLPAALPFIFTGLRLSATVSILILIAAEMMGANSGIGYALYFYQANFLIPQMYAYIMVMAILGTTVNFVLEAVERRSFRWRDEPGSA